MATRSPSLLWNITQPLDANEKAQARSNAGVLLTKNANTGNAIEFIYECIPVNGDIKYNTRKVTVESTFSSSGTNPVNGTAIDKALDTLKIDGGISITAGNYITKITETKGIIGVEQAAMDTSPVADSKKPITSGAVKTAIDTHKHGNINNDGTIATASGFTLGNDTLLIADTSNSGKLVKSGITFNTSGADKDYTFLSKGGEWKSYSAGTDLVFQNNEFSVNTNSSIDELSVSGRSFVIGDGNYMYNSDRSLLGGTQSYMYGADNAFVLGNACIVGDVPSDVTDPSTYSTFSYAFIYGNSNHIASSDCLTAFGEYNTIGNNDDGVTVEGPKHGHNIIFGDNNTISGGKYNICIGQYNNVSINQSHKSPSYTIMIGNHLSWYNPNENDLLILGRYNSTAYRYSSKALHPIRITGCGTENDTANIEELYPGGILWLQTGVEMHKTQGSFSYDSHLFMDNNGKGALLITREAKEDVSGLNPDYSYTRKITDMGYAQRDAVGVSAVTEITGIAAEGATLPSDALQSVQLLNIQRPSLSPSGNLDFQNSCAIEFHDSVRGGMVGMAVGESGIPSWNTTVLSELTNSWLRLYANRTDPDHPETIKMPWEALAGNIEVGKIAVKFFSENDLTQANPLIPGDKVGDLTFITGNGNSQQAVHEFWVMDSDSYTSHSGQAYKLSSYIQANTFCILATRTPTVRDSSGAITSLGSFTALISHR